MFNITGALWEFAARGVIVYFALMILLRISGKRTIGEFTSFDMVVMLLVAESTQGALTGGDESVVGALIVCATLIGLNFLIGFLSARFKVVDKLTEGEPVILIHKGKTFQEALRKNNIPDSDLDEALRHAGLSDRAQVHLAVLETDGEINVIEKREQN